MPDSWISQIFNTSWQCAICGKEIGNQGAGALKISVQIDDDSETSSAQGLRAHKVCFASILHPSVPFDSGALE